MRTVTAAALALITIPLSSALSPDLGLPSNGLQSNGIAIGVLPNFNRNNALTEVNTAFGKGISVIGDYVNVSPRDYSFAQVGYHLPEVVRVDRGDVQAVYSPAILFSESLDLWTDEMTQAVATMARDVNRRGVVVWIRLLFEMNGAWMPYGLQPERFVQIWRKVTLAVRAQTNDTYMLWAPNVWSGELDDPTQGYVPYWPGEDFVDIAGLSFYSFGLDKLTNRPPADNLFRILFQPFNDLLTRNTSSSPLGLTAPKPLVISETSAPFYYNVPQSARYTALGKDVTVQLPYPDLASLEPAHAPNAGANDTDELYIKATWFVQLTSNDTATRFPALKAINWFNYFKTGSETDVLVDFRATGGNATVEAWFRGAAGNLTAFEEGYTGLSGAGRLGLGWVVGMGVGVVCAMMV